MLIRTCRGVVESFDERDDRRFPGPTLADEGHRPSGLDVEAHAAEDLDVRPLYGFKTRGNQHNGRKGHVKRGSGMLAPARTRARAQILSCNTGDT